MPVLPMSIERALLQIISRQLACMEAEEQDRVDDQLWIEAEMRAGAMLAEFDFRRCRHCGCSDDDACAEGCAWAEDDLCTRCANDPPESQATNLDPLFHEELDPAALAAAIAGDAGGGP